MRRLIWIFIAAISVNTLATAQSKWGEDSVKCRENLYIYYELAKGKNYSDAYTPWSYVYKNCPGSSINNFIYGPYIVEAKIKSAEGEAAIEYKKLLMEVYDQRLVHFPEKFDYVYGRKALDMMQYFPDSSKAAYELFKKAMEIGGQEQSAAFFNGYFTSAARLFNDNIFNVADMFQAYNVVIEGIEVNNNILNRQIKELEDKDTAGTITAKEQDELGKVRRELERYEDLASNIEKILGPIATCERLLDIYNEETFAAHQDDKVWLRRASKILAKERKNDEGEYEDCTGNPIFFKIADALYKLEPSANAARSMGINAYRSSDFGRAAAYFKEAATQEIDPKKAAEDYLKMGASYQKTGRLADAKSALLKAASMKKNWGDPYIVLATVYAQGDGSCGENVFEKKAVYWAAIDKLQYAKSIDPSVANKANKLIASYKQQIPNKSVSFQLNHAQGEKYTIGCWINETVTADWNL